MPQATNRKLTVVALLLAMFLAAMEATAVSTAMPTVIGDLGGVQFYAWVFTAYMLTSTISVPIYGKAADLYGRKPVLLFGLALFLAGSALSGMATGIVQLIAYRALQGLGAGAVQTTSLTVVGDLFNLKERARLQGLFAAMWGIAGVSGPLLGGFIVDYMSWQWIFFINLPFGLASTVVLIFAYKETVAKHERKIDWAGALTLTLGVVAILAAANGVHPLPFGVAGAGLVAAFVVIETRAADALLPVDLFSQRLMAIASGLCALAGGAMFPAVTYLPLFVQGAAAGSPTEAGATLTPMMLGWPIASTVTGRLVPRYGFRPFILIGSALTALSTGLLAYVIQAGLPFFWMYAATAVFGVGLGLINTALILAVQTSVPWQRRGVATAATMFFRIIGGTLAVGFLGGYLAHSLAGKAGLPQEVVNDLLGPEHGGKIAPALLAQLTATLKDVLVPIFWTVFAIGAGTTALALLFPKVKTEEAAPGGGEGAVVGH